MDIPLSICYLQSFNKTQQIFTGIKLIWLSIAVVIYLAIVALNANAGSACLMSFSVCFVAFRWKYFRFRLRINSFMISIVKLWTIVSISRNGTKSITQNEHRCVVCLHHYNRLLPNEEFLRIRKKHTLHSCLIRGKQCWTTKTYFGTVKRWY